MTSPSKLSPLFAGVDAPSLDTRAFDVSKKDLETICFFFAIGKLKTFEKEKDIAVSHSNFFVFVKTDRGQYALKFFPQDAGKSISIEHAINRFLVNRDFPTPKMYCGPDRRAYAPCNDRLTTCFSFIDGTPGWKNISQPNTIHQINTTIFALKQALMHAPTNIPRVKQEHLTATARELAQTSKTAGLYDGKNIIEETLKDICRTYQKHRKFFARQWLHNNTTLTNFLLQKNTVHILDLSHIREDYAFTDLASLVISCLFLNIPRSTIKAIIKDYCTVHLIDQKHLICLHTLIQLGLTKEYLKTISREKHLPSSMESKELLKTYTFYLQKRKKHISAILKSGHYSSI